MSGGRRFTVGVGECVLVVVVTARASGRWVGLFRQAFLPVPSALASARHDAQAAINRSGSRLTSQQRKKGAGFGKRASYEL